MCELYDDTDVEGAVLPPSVAIATCQVAETLTEDEMG